MTFKNKKSINDKLQVLQVNTALQCRMQRLIQS